MTVYRPCEKNGVVVCRNKGRRAGELGADCNYVECPDAKPFALTFDTLGGTGWVVVCPGRECGIRMPWTPTRGTTAVRCPLCLTAFRVRGPGVSR